MPGLLAARHSGGFALISAEITVSAFGNRPLDELQRLIDLRVRRLGESATDAAVATMIDAVKSIRAATREAKPGAKAAATVEELDGIRLGRHRTGRPCLRSGAAEFVPKCRVKFLAVPGVRDSEMKVFRVTPEHEIVGSYIVVARSAGDARRFERLCAQHRKERHGGLAKTALGIAMAKMSTRNADTKRFRDIQESRIVSVERKGDGRSVALSVHDRLGFAKLALRGGPSAVGIALAKAANKVSGILVRHLNAHGDLARDMKTPFPEVIQRK